MLGTMMDYPLTLPHFLERAGTLYPTVEIVSRLPDKSIHRTNYAEIRRRAHALASALQKAGLKPGDRVGTLCWNHYAHLEAYFGIPIAGGVLHTLNLRLHPSDIAYIANHAEDRFIIVDDVLLPLLEQFKDEVKAERFIVVPFSGEKVPDGYDDYEEFLKSGGNTFDYPDIEENQAAAMCYTSGTTGRPKGVVYSHRALCLHSLGVCMADSIAVSQHDTMLPVVPMFHANSWGLPYAATLVGAKVVFPGPHMDADSLLELFETEKVTFAAGVPTVWHGLLTALDANPKKWKLGPMRSIVGGSAVPEAMIRGFDKHGIRVIQAWGMTEMTPIGSIGNMKAGLGDLDTDEHYAFRAKQGITVPFVDARVICEDGSVAPWDGETMGELQVRGPWVAANYYNSPEIADRWDDGWFKTGDVVTMDSEGYIKIMDRSKDVIKSGGEWISSVELESELMSHPAIKEAAVIAIPHPKWDERPLACVVLEEGKSLSEQEIKDLIAAKFAKFWIPDAVTFIDEVPKTSVGKFQKTTLRERFKDWTWDEARKTG